MNKTKIDDGVKKVISQNSRYTYEEIDAESSLDKFIGASMADRLARELGRKFDRIDVTLLTNKLYTAIKTVKDLNDYIITLYNEA